jgi:hypothetical protein
MVFTSVIFIMILELDLNCVPEQKGLPVLPSLLHRGKPRWLVRSEMVGGFPDLIIVVLD